ncbi:hypothetical protein TNCV_4566071 [Trichonephila clavipes]|nr:hypothetical protein TNCV_4566071 [Trichonephila clavipes]
MVLKVKANDRRTSSPCHDEFRGPRSDYVRQVALGTTTTFVDLASRKTAATILRLHATNSFCRFRTFRKQKANLCSPWCRSTLKLPC